MNPEQRGLIHPSSFILHPSLPWETHHEARPLTHGRFDSDRASMRLDNAIRDAQAKPRSFALRLGREKRIKDLLPNGGINPGARIGDEELHAGRRRTRPDRYLPSRRTGIDRIGHQVEYYLINLGRI